VQACEALLCWDWENTTENTIFSQHHQQRSPGQYSPPPPPPHPPPPPPPTHPHTHTLPRVPALNISHITESQSHEIANVNHQITYLSDSSAGILRIKHAFCRSSILKAITFWLVILWGILHNIFDTSKVTYCKIIEFFFIKSSRFQEACALTVKSVHIHHNYYKASQRKHGNKCALNIDICMLAPSLNQQLSIGCNFRLNFFFI